jgi:hypothetical protein
MATASIPTLYRSTSIYNIRNSTSHRNPSKLAFHQPNITSKPSITTQIVHQPTQILDPYLLNLQQNYYYPLSPEPDITDMDDTQMANGTAPSSPTREECSTDTQKSPSKDTITVEHSLSVISEFISEFVANDPPTQLHEEPVIEKPEQTTYRHRFSLYKKNSVPVPGTPTTSLRLFQSLFRSIKAADQSTKILPIRSDVKSIPCPPPTR